MNILPTLLIMLLAGFVPSLSLLLIPFVLMILAGFIGAIVKVNLMGVLLGILSMAVWGFVAFILSLPGRLVMRKLLNHTYGKEIYIALNIIGLIVTGLFYYFNPDGLFLIRAVFEGRVTF